MILASRSAGITLPLKDCKDTVHVLQASLFTLPFFFLANYCTVLWHFVALNVLYESPTSHLCSAGLRSQYQSPEQLQPSLWSSGSVGTHMK